MAVADPDPSERVDSPLRFVLCDLDGVVWLRRVPIPGSADAVAQLREHGARVLFVTNNSMSPIAEQEAALDAIGIPARDDVVTSAQAAAALVASGSRVLVCGGPGVTEAVTGQGGTTVRSGDADAVIVGLHQDFDYERMQAASTAIRAGARFIATNDDATYPTPSGPIPGAGALVAAVATASETPPTVAGKPHGPMADLVRHRCGVGFSADATVVVGDRWSTDGLFARTIGCRFALVRSGVTPPGATDVAADLDGPDLADIAARLVPG